MIDIVDIQQMPDFDVDAYFRALIAVARSDQLLGQEEEGFIRDQARVMGYDVEPLLASAERIEVNLAAASNLTKRLVLRDCIFLAYADQNYEVSEKTRIRQIAEASGIDARLLARIELWVMKYWDVMEEGNELFLGGAE